MGSPAHRTTGRRSPLPWPSATRSRCPTMPGFGASSKPREHRYSLLEQAGLVEALWGRGGIESTVIVAHDYSVSVAQELLMRRAAGTLAVDLRALHFLNGGLYPDLHRPQPAQVDLLDPEQGPQISAAMNGELFIAGLAPTFPEGTTRLPMPPGSGRASTCTTDRRTRIS